MSCAKTAEPMEMLFGIWIWVDSGKQVLDRGAHWRNLASAIEPFVCGSDAAFCQITFTTFAGL